MHLVNFIDVYAAKFQGEETTSRMTFSFVSDFVANFINDYASKHEMSFFLPRW